MRRLSDDAIDSQVRQQQHTTRLGLRMAEQEYSRRYKLGTSFIYCGSLFAVGCGFGARGPSLTSLARQCGMVEDDGQLCGPSAGANASATECSDECVESDIDQMAWANACFNIGFILCSFGAGFVLDTVRSWHVVLSASGAIAAVAMILQTMIRSPGPLYATFGVLGIVCAFPATATQAGPIWVWREGAGPSLHMTNAMFGVGMGLAPFLVSLNKSLHCQGIWTLGGESDFHESFIIVAVLTILIAVAPLLLTSPRPPAEPQAAGDDAENEGVDADQQPFFARTKVLWALFFAYKFFCEYPPSTKLFFLDCLRQTFVSRSGAAAAAA
jgi:hypothetical protein